jgi:hypothetical protein
MSLLSTHNYRRLSSGVVSSRQDKPSFIFSSVLFFGANRVKIGNMSAARSDLQRKIKNLPPGGRYTSSPGDVNAIEQVSEFILHNMLYICMYCCWGNSYTQLTDMAVGEQQQHV